MDQQAQEIQQLEQLLSEAVTAERFFEQDTGRLFKQLAEAEINRLIRDITSDKFLKDHAGYVNAVLELRSYQKLLRKMQIAGSQQRKQKIKERLAGPEESA